MTTNVKIIRGPNAFDMAANLFRPQECELLHFHHDNDSHIAASIQCARCLDADGEEWELELYMPFPQAYRLKVSYNCHTRKGEILEAIEENPGFDPELEHQLERAEHAMAHGAR